MTVEGGLDEPEELEPAQGSLQLAAPEDNHDRAAWERAAAGVLRKAGRLGEADPDARVWEELARTTLDGIPVTPLGTPSSTEGLTTVGRPDRTGGWDIRPHVDLADPKLAQEAALLDLANGATSLWLELAPGADQATILDGVLLELAPVVLDAPQDQVAAAQAFLDVLGDTDPAEGTNLGGRVSAGSADLLEVARLARGAGTLGAVVDATEVHDRGASEVQELAYSLALGASYLRTLTAEGFGLDEALGLVEFRYAATDEQFVTIAKLRAARRLWARVVELSGGTVVRQRQHVVTGRPMMAKYDPWVNMLRTTVAAFAAGVGGADAVTVLPFDTALGVPDAFARRIARNTSSLLISESHVARVADPAGGAYAVERLTDDLAVAAWAELGRIEADGLDALDERIAEVVVRRDEQVAHRTRPLTGVSEFPHLGETLPVREPRSTGPARDAVRRYGAPFEALRDEPTERTVFLATLGSVAAHTARATFATNLLAAGGVAVDVAGPTEGVADVLAAYDDQPVVCLAGPDATYAAWGADLVSALREAGARWVVLAGRPGDLDVDDTCAVGDDALAFLTRTREQLR